MTRAPYLSPFGRWQAGRSAWRTSTIRSVTRAPRLLRLPSRSGADRRLRSAPDFAAVARTHQPKGPRE